MIGAEPRGNYMGISMSSASARIRITDTGKYPVLTGNVAKAPIGLLITNLGPATLELYFHTGTPTGPVAAELSGFDSRLFVTTEHNATVGIKGNKGDQYFEFSAS
jgi:hypothetical protein